MKGVSFVLPCLNEEKSLGAVLQRIESVRASGFSLRETEVIVSDNGSIDKSVEIATSFGAKVVLCNEKGYGANLKNGIRHARYPIVVFADADNTYDLLESVALIKALEDSSADLVLGSRFRGAINRDAMPVLHKHLGTPVLNFLINAFHGVKSSTRITDCNSGFRCFYKSAYDSWGVVSDGMDFASEMLLKALKSQACIKEVPITLSKSDQSRVPHLKTWQDGMKHLLRFFVESPHFFSLIGVLLFILGLALLIPSLLIDVAQVGPLQVFGFHTTMIASLVTGTGIQLWCFGAFIALKDYKKNLPVNKSYRWIIEIREDKLFWTVFLYFFLIALFLGYVFVAWRNNHFQFLDLGNVLLVVIFCITGLSSIAVNIVAIHILKRV